MLSCRQTTVLLSQSLDRSLTLRERLSVRMHLLLCRLCRRYGRQLSVISDAIRRLVRHGQGAGLERVRLPEDKKKRLQSTIDRIAGGGSRPGPE